MTIQNKILITCFWAFCFIIVFCNELRSQNKKLRDAELIVFRQYGVALGNNVYNNYHSDFWKGFGVSTGCYIQKKIYLGFELSRMQSEVTDKNIIYNDNTKINYRVLNLGYRFTTFNHFDLTSYFRLGSNKGKNQGEFRGNSYGIGTKIVRQIFNNGMIFLSMEWDTHRFNIQSNPKWEEKFNNTSMLRGALGGGLAF